MEPWGVNPELGPAEPGRPSAGSVQAKRKAMEHELCRALDAYRLLTQGDGGSGDRARHDDAVPARASAELLNETSVGRRAMEPSVPTRTDASQSAEVVHPTAQPRPVISDPCCGVVTATLRDPVGTGGARRTAESTTQRAGSMIQWESRGGRDFSVSIHLANGVANVLIAAPKEHEALARETLFDQLQRQNLRIGRIRLNGAIVYMGADSGEITQTGECY